MTDNRRTLRILGIRGVPAAHGGFETFAEHLSLYLVRKGWRVVVYCQEDGVGPTINDTWEGVERVRIPVPDRGLATSIIFDWKSISHAVKHQDLCLTLGYNTALFCLRLRMAGVTNIINMDGIEWSRAKWGPLAKTWFWLNDWAGCWIGNHLVADHPEIKNHLITRANSEKITTIAYGAEAINEASEDPVRKLGLEPGKYLTLIARPEPENSVLEVVSGFSKRKRGLPLVILGNYDKLNPFHAKVLAAASDEVKFVGAIYDKRIVQSLRYHCLAYVHGHQVGGTNPSLVEALGASNAILAHDNKFNRWVAHEGALYFADPNQFDQQLSTILSNSSVVSSLRHASAHRFRSGFTWDSILAQYESLMEQHLHPSSGAIENGPDIA